MILKGMLYEALHYCKKANLTVVAIVCDQEASQTRLFKELGVTPQSPFLVDPNGPQNIAVILDPPHLLKNFRNNLMKYDIVVSTIIRILCRANLNPLRRNSQTH
jgi:hypothetical protein